MANPPIVLTNLDFVPGYTIHTHYGLMVGSSVRTRHLAAHLWAFFMNLFGGEVDTYSDLLAEVAKESLERLTLKAKAAGANAILNIRFATSEIASGAAEIMVYGTVVTLVKSTKTTKGKTHG